MEIKPTNYKEFILRSPLIPNDAEKLIDLFKKVTNETSYLSRKENEITESFENTCNFFNKLNKSNNDFSIVVEKENKIIGHLVVKTLHYYKTNHRAKLSIYILKEYWGKGLGTKLLELTDFYAGLSNLNQIELEVNSSNNRAINLYEKNMFIKYGIIPNAYKKNNGYSDQIIMIKKYKN